MAGAKFSIELEGAELVQQRSAARFKSTASIASILSLVTSSAFAIRNRQMVSRGPVYNCRTVQAEILIITVQ